MDLNLGCPLPGAHEGGFGAYMLLPERRGLLLSIVAAMSQAVALPNPRKMLPKTLTFFAMFFDTDIQPKWNQK